MTHGMACPRCRSQATVVLETRTFDKGETITRRRECPCGTRWTTAETVKSESIRALPVAAIRHVKYTTRSVGQSLQVAIQEEPKALPVAPANDPPPLQIAANPLSVVDGGVGGGLSSGPLRSDLGPGSDPDSSQPSERGRNVMEVLAHYRVHHPRALPRPSKTSKEWRLIEMRLREGHTVDDLKRAIDGYHLSPYHCGQNEHGTKYLDLTLICRDSTHVTRGIGFLEQPQAPRSLNGSARAEFIARHGGAK